MALYLMFFENMVNKRGASMIKDDKNEGEFLEQCFETSRIFSSAVFALRSFFTDTGISALALTPFDLFEYQT